MNTCDEPPSSASGSPGPRGVSLGSYTDTEWDITTGVGFTALAVAAGREMETRRPDPLITDPYGAAFVHAAGAAVPLPTGWPPDTDRLANSADVDAGQLRQVWQTMATYMGVRSRFFDHQLQTACQQGGIRQVVLLAAGLDTRPVRLAWPAGTAIFEIDHPNVLAFKDRVLAGQQARLGARRHPVGVDLRGDWPAALAQAGFDPHEPTAWLAEGLLFFLPDDAKHQLTHSVHTLSAPGSRWAIESMPDPAAAARIMADNQVLARISAQFGADPTGLWPPEQHWEPHPWLVEHGWTVTAASAHTVAARHGRVLDGPAPMAEQQHPSMLLTAAAEHPTSTEDDTTGQQEQT